MTFEKSTKQSLGAYKLDEVFTYQCVNISLLFGNNSTIQYFYILYRTLEIYSVESDIYAGLKIQSEMVC